jgi:hypothetical protein
MKYLQHLIRQQAMSKREAVLSAAAGAAAGASSAHDKAKVMPYLEALRYLCVRSRGLELLVYAALSGGGAVWPLRGRARKGDAVGALYVAMYTYT